MSSLQQLLTEDGFENGTKLSTKLKQGVSVSLHDSDSSATLPMYICHDLQRLHHKAEETSTRKGSSSKRHSSDYTTGLGREEPPMDEVAIRAVVSILSGYIGRYVKDETFRCIIKHKLKSCLSKVSDNDYDNGVLSKLELGVSNIEKLIEDVDTATKKQHRVTLLRNSIQLLTIVASLNSKKSKSDLSAFGHLYLSIIYKIEKNDRISSRHLLQVFCHSPFLARTQLLPDLWEHFFLPHLLHLKIWFHKELECLSNLQFGERERRIKELSKVYDDQMDLGTVTFAVYYKQWLKIGSNPPTVPVVPLPTRTYAASRRRSSNSYASQSSKTSNDLYQAVFGSTYQRRSMDTVRSNRESIDEYSYSNFNHVQSKRPYESQFRQETQKLGGFRLFTCQGEDVQAVLLSRKDSIRYGSRANYHSTELRRAIKTICSSDSLVECETGIRFVAKFWLNSHGDPATEADLSKKSIIEGMLEVLFASNNDEVLELAISILAEIVSRNDSIRQNILNFDPQLKIFVKLLRNSSLFLKAGVLLYLVKPKAKQMISTEWVPLVLRLVEFGDSLQTLFTVTCNAQVAAFYFLDQLVNGFDEDKNLENAREVVSLGGLAMLVGRIDKGDVNGRRMAVSIILCCIRADETCKNYLAESVNKASILELIAVENHNYTGGRTFTLLTELLCQTRRTQMKKFLEELKCGWGGFNTMHILLVHLQKSPPEEQPLIAVILLLLDLMGDPLESSTYREEAVDILTAALDCQKCCENVQRQSARALMILGCTNEATAGKWLLNQEGYQDNSFHLNEEEEEAAEVWQRKAASALLKTGKNKRLLVGLANCIANAIPSLARASLYTIAWMTNYLHSTSDQNLLSMASSVLLPQLIQSSSYHYPLDEQLLASFSFHRLTSTLAVGEDLVSPLRNQY